MNSSFSIDAQLNTRSLGRVCHYVAETGSTNQDAFNDTAATHGTVYVAGRQHAGRGRLAHAWFSPPDANLYCSLVLQPGTLDPAHAATLPLVIGLAVARALEHLDETLQPRIKWPNDIWLDAKKLCGILCEMRADGTLIAGIGMNIAMQCEDFPPELRDTATSLAMATGKAWSRESILATLLNTFEPLYLLWCDNGFAPFTENLLPYDLLRGESLTIHQVDNDPHPLHGKGAGIRDDGALLVQTGRTCVPVFAGEAHILF